MPDHRTAIFAFANRTYAGPSTAVWDAAVALSDAELLEKRDLAVSDDLAKAYRAVGAIYRQGDINAGGDVLAMNFLLDRDADKWRRELADLRKKVGECDTSAAVKPRGALAGEFIWRCAHGRVSGSVLLAPTRPSRIQGVKLEVKAP
jgi:serine-type D-Ala-D-Ala carboxypeptidase/endopeptidase